MVTLPRPPGMALRPAAAPDDDHLAAIIALQRDLAGVRSDAGAIMRLIVEYAERLTGADGTAVEMVEGEESVYRAARGTALPFLGTRLPLRGSLAGLVAGSEEALRCDDSETDGRVDRAACRRIGVRSFAVIPLRHDGRFIGGLTALAAAPHAFDDTRMRLLHLLAGFLAAGLGHARAEAANLDLVRESTTTLGALLESEERYRHLVQLSPDAIVVFDDETYRFANAAAATLFGVADARDLVGRDIHGFVPEDIEPDVREYFDAARRDGTRTGPTETRMVRDDGTVVEIEVSGMRIEFRGKPARMSVVRDITARREAERALHASETRYRFVIAALEEGIVVQDRDGRITAMNASAERILGVSFADIEERDGIDPRAHAVYEDGSFFPDDDHPAAVALRTGVAELHVLMGFPRPDGRVTWASVNAQPLFHPGEAQPYAAVSSYTDITERKRKDEELRTFSEELQRSNRELQDFASVTSHDLKEPLRKIQAFGSRLEARSKDALSPEGRDYLSRMLSAAARMERLIDDILAYSRVSSKAKPFERVDLNEIVAAILSDLEVRIEQTGAVVTVETLPTIDADPMQMRQLFQNLIGNALKFHREGVPPAVRVMAHRVPGRERGTQARDHYHLIVQDNGIGFDEKYLDRIFTVFQRLNTRVQYEGSGVGLAICRKIAEGHGGTISARSAPDQGATFVVTLPVGQKHELT